jgi:hypothetical protein
MTDDELLTPGPVPANDPLKAELLHRTGRRVRLASRVRFAGRAAVCLACFAAGAGAVRLLPAADQRIESVAVRKVPAADAHGSPPPAVVRVPSPAELELQAEQTPVKAEAARRFREAGDRYLRDYADYRAALRCYRNFLDEADPDQLQVTPDDTWLLTSLKRARELESTQ